MILVQISLVIIVLIFIMILLVKRFFYFRPASEFLEPEIPIEELSEGNIHAWFIKGQGDKVILFCHGNTGNLSHRQNKLSELNKLGYSVLIFDYRGYGQSSGVPNEQVCYHDACMYTTWLLQRYDKKNIVMYGESMGAAVAIHVATKYKIKMVIIESGIPDMSTMLWKPLRVLSFIFKEFDTVGYLKYYTEKNMGRVLVLHCVNDEIIPWGKTELMRSLATKTIEMEGNHFNPIIPWVEIDNFIKES